MHGVPCSSEWHCHAWSRELLWSSKPSGIISGPQLGWHSAKWHHCKGKSNLSVATCKEKFKLSVLSILLAKYTQKCLMKSMVWLCLDNSMQAFFTFQDANQAQESHGLLAGHVPGTGPRNPGIRVLTAKIQVSTACVTRFRRIWTHLYQHKLGTNPMPL